MASTSADVAAAAAMASAKLADLSVHASPLDEFMASTSADIAAAAAMASAKLADLSVHAPPLDEFTANADEIIPGLWLGSEIAADDPAALRAHGISHVLVPAYTGHPHTPPPLHEGQFTYCIWPVMDVKGFPIIHAFPAFVLWIERAMARGGRVRVGSATAEGKEETEGTGTGTAGGRGGVLVHCASGVSRSTSVVVAYLMKAQGLSAGDAYALVREKRPKISEDKFRPQLDLWGELGFSLDGAAAGAAGGGGDGNGTGEGGREGSEGAGVASAAAHGAALEELARLYSIRKIQKMKKAISGETQTVWEEVPRREEEEEEEEEVMFGMMHSSSGRQGGFGDASSDNY